MSSQEPKLIQELLLHGGSLASGDIRRLAMLHLNSTTSPPCAQGASAPKEPRPKFEKCSQCGTIKRRSPLPSSSKIAAADGGSDHQCNMNKQIPPPNTSSTAAATSSGVITPPPLPPPSSLHTTLLLQPLSRSLSEPIFSEETQKGQEIFSSLNQFFNPLSPENSKTGGTTSSPSPSPAMTSLPPLPPPLRRTMSEPTGADPQGLVMVPSATTPPPPPSAPRSVKRSPGSDESPDSKRLKRIKERVKEMSLWWGQVMHEEDEDFNSEQNFSPATPKDEYETENEHEEAVWVEKQGEGLVIHFKCPCGKGYAIFLMGNNCYYKLT